MKIKTKHNGFSLTEVLMAVGILTVGMLMVAMMFPLGIHLTTVSVERTMAAIVTDEAFAKIQLRGINIAVLSGVGTKCVPLRICVNKPFDANEECAYPSIDPGSDSRQYYWDALCRKLVSEPNDSSVQVTVFAGRKSGAGNTFSSYDHPIMVYLSVSPGPMANQITISATYQTFVNPPASVVAGNSGNIYRVIKRGGDDPSQDNILTLDRDWNESSTSTVIWFMRPPDGAGGANTATGANPDIGVFQRIIKF